MADAKLVKELRDRTGAGFLDVKKALEASDNDMDKAIAWLQERGVAKAAKKAGNISAEGVVAIAQDENSVVMFEVNAQTDFVAQYAEFLGFVETIGKGLLQGQFTTAEEANDVEFNGKTLKDITVEATAKIGENIQLRRAIRVSKSEGIIGAYVHGNKQIASIVVTEGGTEEAARNVAMHVASMNPQFLDEAAVPAEKVAEIKQEISENPSLANKPEKIRPNIEAGMLRKALSELTLVDQEFVMEKMPVSKYLASAGAKAKAMFRFEVAEGIEKKEEDFAAEVAAQMAK